MKSKYFACVSFCSIMAIILLMNFLCNIESSDRENISICATFIALIIATFSFRKNESFNERLEIFIKGSSQSIVVHMCYILFLTTIFTTVLEHTGSIESAVNVCLHVFPNWLFLPGIFFGASLFTFTVGSSIGTIAAFMPVAINIAHHIQLNPSLMAATIVGGCVFGDNLSISSDSTILSVKITDTTMVKKFYLNMKICLPAFIITILFLIYHNSFIPGCGHVHNLLDVSFLDVIKALPYTITFLLALTGLDIIFVTVIGIMIAMGIGIYLQNFTIPMAMNFMFDGFYHAREIVNLFILSVLLSGLVAIITHNGGVEYIIKKLKEKISNTWHAKFVIFGVVALVNIVIAINSIAIIVAGPAVQKIGYECQIEPAETACILGIVSCSLQGLLPYAPQIIMAASIAQVSSTSLIPYLYYQFFLLVSLCINLCKNNKICKSHGSFIE
jgi:Na+/H+ antiporter NhaC